jgi:hypothetical protein
MRAKFLVAAFAACAEEAEPPIPTLAWPDAATCRMVSVLGPGSTATVTTDPPAAARAVTTWALAAQPPSPDPALLTENPDGSATFATPVAGRYSASVDWTYRFGRTTAPCLLDVDVAPSEALYIEATFEQGTVESLELHRDMPGGTSVCGQGNCYTGDFDWGEPGLDVHDPHTNQGGHELGPYRTFLPELEPVDYWFRVSRRRVGEPLQGTVRVFVDGVEAGAFDVDLDVSTRSQWLFQVDGVARTVLPLDDAAVDADQDGFPRATDCDDANPDVSPAGVERCNYVDDDCDGAMDINDSDVVRLVGSFDSVVLEPGQRGCAGPVEIRNLTMREGSELAWGPVRVLDHLRVEGTEASPVRWDGVDIDVGAADGSAPGDATVRHLGALGGSMWVRSTLGAVLVEDSRLDSLRGLVDVEPTESFVYRRVFFAENPTWRIYADDVDVRMENVRFDVYRTPLDIRRTTGTGKVVATGCTFTPGTDPAVALPATPVLVDLRGNWWGTVDLDHIQARIMDLVAPSSPPVEPFLTQPDPLTPVGE